MKRTAQDQAYERIVQTIELQAEIENLLFKIQEEEVTTEDVDLLGEYIESLESSIESLHADIKLLGGTDQAAQKVAGQDENIPEEAEASYAEGLRQLFALLPNQVQRYRSNYESLQGLPDSIIPKSK